MSDLENTLNDLRKDIEKSAKEHEARSEEIKKRIGRCRLNAEEAKKFADRLDASIQETGRMANECRKQYEQVEKNCSTKIKVLTVVGVVGFIAACVIGYKIHQK